MLFTVHCTNPQLNGNLFKYSLSGHSLSGGIHYSRPNIIWQHKCLLCYEVLTRREDSTHSTKEIT